jgi:minor histocompatibility antigen H13
MANSKIKVNKGITLPSLLDQNKLEKVTTTEDNEAMSKKDAAMFPVYLSGYLFGLYLLFKVVEKDVLQSLLTGFFSLMGVSIVQI